MSHGVISPMTRIVPRDGAQISGYFIPGGVSSYPFSFPRAQFGLH